MELLELMNRWLMACGLTARGADQLDQFIVFALLLLVAFGMDFICRFILLRVVTSLVKRTRVTWDDILLDRSVLVHLSRMVAPLVLSITLPMAFDGVQSVTLTLIGRLCHILILVTFLSFVNSLLKAIYAVYSAQERFRDRPLKGLLQTVQVALWFVGGIVVIALLLDKSPLSLLAGLGASAAVLMLIFKASIMGVVSGVQLSANDMLKVGDWIAMPKYGADGTVIEVTLNTVKVRNWDNTITTIPPYLLVSDSFQNWRGMTESGGRRVKRSVNIDMNSVRFCTPQMLDKYRRIKLLADYIDQTEQVIKAYNAEQEIDNSVLVNGRRQTNLGVFRAYLSAYLHNLPGVRDDMTLLVRHLQPTDHGIPIELYFFTRTTEWGAYEKIQADVFDHLLAIVPEFDLRVFQSPTGADFNPSLDRRPR